MSTDTDAAFLKQIETEPTNALHREVYADWLEEQGDPRAELLRIQEQLRKIEVPDRLQVESRMHELLGQGLKPLEIVHTAPAGMEFVLIFPGEFMMGAPESETVQLLKEDKRLEWNDCLDEMPQHPVRITRPFYMSRFPVTLGQFREYAGNSRHQETPWEDVWFPQEESCPVVQVTFKNAGLFARWLKKQDGRSYRLPWEAEWEYSCRAGTSTGSCFGEFLLPTQANFHGEYPYHSGEKGEFLARTTPVDKYQPNPWGLYDMHGNVWEWCRDYFADDYYHHSPTTDPQGAERGSKRIVRGGGWSHYGSHCRSASRFYYSHGTWDDHVGFRLAMDWEPPT